MQGTITTSSKDDTPGEAQGQPATRLAGERLVKLGKIKAGIGPVLAAARNNAQEMERLYHEQGLKDPLYHDMKAIIGPLDRLFIRVDCEIDKVLRSLTEEQIPDQVQNSPDLTSKLRRRLKSVT